MILKFSCTLLLVLAFCCVPAEAQSQSDTHRFEVGALITALDLRDTNGEKPGGIGGRFTYNVTEYVAFDSELTRFPEDPSHNFGHTQGHFGIKAGKRFSDLPFGVFAKVRPGFVSFGGAFAARSEGIGTRFAADVGGVLEFYPSSRTIIRFDVGQTIIHFDGQLYNSPVSPPRRLDTNGRLQTSIGFSYRF
jgi:hypothetical protein